MSTHSIIATPMDNGFRGRYCHQDGYPTHQARVLLEIIAALGVARATEVLTREHHSWSVLTASTYDLTHRQGFLAVTGVGRAYPHDEPDQWYDQRSAREMADYVYVLNTTSLAVLANSGDGFTHRGSLAYERCVSEADLIALECGTSYERCAHYAWVHVPAIERSDKRTMRQHLAAGRA